MSVCARAVVALATLVACRREPAPTPARRAPTPVDAPRPRAPATSPTTSPPTTPAAAPSPCDTGWRDEALELPALEQNALPWEAACAGDAVVVTWRVGTELHVARHGLARGATWSTPRVMATGVSSFGVPAAAGDAVWVPWVTLQRELTATRVGAVEARAGSFTARRSGAFADVRALGARGDVALVAVTYRHGREARAGVVRLGLDGTVAGAVLGDGEVLAVDAGARPLAVVGTREPRAEGGPWVLRGHRVDLDVAARLEPAATGFGTAPEGLSLARGALPVGAGRFEFGAFAGRAGAVILQTVLGAERGRVRVAWFADGAEAAQAVMPFAAAGLVGAFDDDGGVHVRYWDDLNVPQRARVARDGPGPAQALGPAEDTARLVQALARDTRVVRCGDRPWVVQARVASGRARLRAAPAACEALPAEARADAQ